MNDIGMNAIGMNSDADKKSAMNRTNGVDSRL